MVLRLPLSLANSLTGLDQASYRARGELSPGGRFIGQCDHGASISICSMRTAQGGALIARFRKAGRPGNRRRTFGCVQGLLLMFVSGPVALP
jgi:hypothetical protein